MINRIYGAIKKTGYKNRKLCLLNAAKNAVRSKLCLLPLALVLLAACSKQPATGYKLVLVQDSARAHTEQTGRVQDRNRIGKQEGAQVLVGKLKAAKLAVEKFNAKTNINNLALKLEFLDLGQVHLDSAAALQNYLNHLQSNNNPRQRWIVTGFIMSRGNSPALEKFADLLLQKSQVLIGNWQNGLPYQQGQAESAKVINLARPIFEENQYLHKFVVGERQLNSVFVVFDAEHQALAKDFLERGRAGGGLELTPLEYIVGRANYAEGQISSLADLLREQRINIQRREKRYGIVMFLNSARVEQSNEYLARSPYRYLFDDIDFILSGNFLDIGTISNPDSPHYFSLRRLVDDQQQRNLRALQREYQKIYHLRASNVAIELYDAVSLLAYSAKKAIENLENENNLLAMLYQNLLQAQFDGDTGRISFDENGQRLTDYEVLQFQELRTASNAKAESQFGVQLGVYSAASNRFVKTKSLD